MRRSLRVLFVGLTDPFPPTNGHRLRDWLLLRALARSGHEVSLIAFAEAAPTAETLEALRRVCASVATVQAPPNHLPITSSGRQRLRAALSPMPYGAWRFRSPEMFDAVSRHLRGQATDVIICDDIYAIPNVPRSSAPVLLNKHDITHVIVRRYLEHRRNPLVKAYGWIEYRKLERWELTACRAAAGVIACSELDRSILQKHCPDVRISVAPNVIDVEDYAVAGGVDGHTAIYVGAMDWYPNEDAVEFFVRQILPHLRRRSAGLRFVIAGRNPSDGLRRRLEDPPHVVFTGSVADIRTEIARATVCVVPLRIGSGTRLKILEAAAMGKAVVSTTLGAEGLDFQPNREIVLADEPERFAQAAVDLLRDSTRRRELGLAARARVEASYSLPVLQRCLTNALDELTAIPTSRAVATLREAPASRR